MASSPGEASVGRQLDMKRYLPLAAVVTALVVALPAYLVSLIEPKGDPAILLLSVPLAMGMSVAVAAVLSAIWSRKRGSVDLVFGELMLWGWWRRYRAERRLGEAATILAPTGRAAKRGGAADEAQVDMLQGLIRLLERRDPYTLGHGRRVTGHCERIARRMGIAPGEIAKLRTAASLHDIGKVKTPTRILHNPGALSEDELAVVRRHAVDGAALVAAIGDPEITDIVRHHHERFDGGGYPDGLAGEDIPLGARVIAVADTFDAMTTDRPYRDALSHREALDEIDEASGTQFDPRVVAAFRAHYSSERSIAWASLAAAAPQRVVAFGASLLPGVGGGAVAGVGGAAQGIAAAGIAGLLGLSLGGELRDTPRTAKAGDRGEVRRDAAPGPTGAAPPAAEPDLPGPPRNEDQGERERRPKPQRDGQPSPTGDGGTPVSGPPTGGTPGDRPPPPVTSPEVETPPVSVPPIGQPPVETPPVRIPPIEIPPVKVPPIEVPGIELPGIGLTLSIGQPGDL